METLRSVRCTCDSSFCCRLLESKFLSVHPSSVRIPKPTHDSAFSSTEKFHMVHTHFKSKPHTFTTANNFPVVNLFRIHTGNYRLYTTATPFKPKKPGSIDKHVSLSYRRKRNNKIRRMCSKI